MTSLHQSEGDELVAVERQVADAHPPLLLDELGHRLQLLRADVDKLAPEKSKILKNLKKSFRVLPILPSMLRVLRIKL